MPTRSPRPAPRRSRAPISCWCSARRSTSGSVTAGRRPPDLALPARRRDRARGLTRDDRGRRRRRRGRLRVEGRLAPPAGAVARSRPARLSRRRSLLRAHRQAPAPRAPRDPDRRRRRAGAQRHGARDGGALRPAARLRGRQRRRLGPDPQPAALVLRRGARGGHLAAAHALRSARGGARRAWRAVWLNARGAGPDWMPGFRPLVTWVMRWDAGALPDADVLLATAWQSAPVVAAAPARCGAKFYLVQHYESLYHGEPEVVDATYRLPLRKIVISTWLADVMRETFGATSDLLVTPVDRALFHRVETPVTTSRPRVLMLHHEYAWKGVADGLEAVR